VAWNSSEWSRISMNRFTHTLFLSLRRGSQTLRRAPMAGSGSNGFTKNAQLRRGSQTPRIAQKCSERALDDSHGTETHRTQSEWLRTTQNGLRMHVHYSECTQNAGTLLRMRIHPAEHTQNAMVSLRITSYELRMQLYRSEHVQNAVPTTHMQSGDTLQPLGKHSEWRPIPQNGFR
jgi:hypothetical protein